MEKLVITLILVVGWPTLLGMTFLIVKRGCGYYKKLKETIIGRLIIPTVFGWLFGMYALGIVATAYMFYIPWYYTVIPAFLTFMVAIQIVYRAIKTWEKEATELRDFYHNLEKLVKERTKELEEAHKKELKHEKEIQKLKDQFVFIAAHELKTPVTAIRWSLELALEEGKKSLDKETVEHLESVQSSNARLITLVDDLLNVARIEAGTIKVEPSDIDLDSLIKSTVKEMRSVFKEKNVKVNYESSGKQMVYADKDRVKQVLINLLSNATKYNKDKGEILVQMKSEDGLVKVSVKDTGIGIKPDDLKKLFKKFSRVESDETNDIEGTGLGLYLCKEIVTKLGGKISADSEYGKGSEFTFTLQKKKPKK